jgi:hypothetical protein
MFERRAKSPSFGADFQAPGGSGRVFRMLLDSSVEKIRIWFDVDYCVHHGRWVIPRIDSGVAKALQKHELSGGAPVTD